LKSDPSLRSGVIDFVEEVNSSSEGLSIKLIDENGQPLSYASVTVNGNNANGFNVDENGYGSYETTDLKSMTINYLGNQYEYVLTKPRANNLILTIRLQSEAIMFFNNEVWKVQRKKLVGKNNLILRLKQ
jgi:FlaG/FlaF family flagellin (archaellin)